MSYATYSDFTARYATRLEPAELTSHYLTYAAARLDGLLGAHFTVPFSANNVTARDLTIDLAYLLILQRSRESGDTGPLGAAVAGRLTALAAGREAMVTASGETLFARAAAGGVWSSTAGVAASGPDADCPDGEPQP
jgi:phage gp36-like protein